MTTKVDNIKSKVLALSQVLFHLHKKSAWLATIKNDAVLVFYFVSIKLCLYPFLSFFFLLYPCQVFSFIPGLFFRPCPLFECSFGLPKCGNLNTTFGALKSCNNRTNQILAGQPQQLWDLQWPIVWSVYLINILGSLCLWLGMLIPCFHPQNKLLTGEW